MSQVLDLFAPKSAPNAMMTVICWTDDNNSLSNCFLSTFLMLGIIDFHVEGEVSDLAKSVIWSIRLRSHGRGQCDQTCEPGDDTDKHLRTCTRVRTKAPLHYQS
jgi:hypothetical protein